MADTLVGSYIAQTSVSTGSAADIAASRKIAKYIDLSTARSFVPLAFETLGPICDSGTSFLDELGGRLIAVTADKRETGIPLSISVTCDRTRELNLFHQYIQFTMRVAVIIIC